jgi:hypothetical protein
MWSPPLNPPNKQGDHIQGLTLNQVAVRLLINLYKIERAKKKEKTRKTTMMMNSRMNMTRKKEEKRTARKRMTTTMKKLTMMIKNKFKFTWDAILTTWIA